MSTPSRSRTPRTLTAILITGLLTGSGLALGPVGQAAAAPAPPSEQPTLDQLLPSGTRSWFVRTTGAGALATDRAAQGARNDQLGVAPQAEQRARELRASLGRISRAATAVDEDAEVLYEAVWTAPGVAIHADAAAAQALLGRADVVSVTPIVSKQLVDPVPGSELGPLAKAAPTNAASDTLTRALDTWVDTGLTGAGKVIAVVDTGLDYTHADFGGSGKVADWYAAGNRTEMAPGSFDPTVVLPGHDFAGMRYNASQGDPTYQPVPQPDDNPIDGPGGGHGTHVAGTAAGRGVTANGRTFRGDHTRLTRAKIAAMKVAPGSAPGAKILPLKVFGDFGGSTDLSGAALDWIGARVAAGEQIDVVNMSLGSSWTAVDDPDNLLLDALVDAGVLPVISAGNSGDLTDVAGSPGNAEGPLAVAASASGYARFDTVEVAEPADLAGKGPFLAQYSQEQWYPFDLTAPVRALSAANATGCDPYSDADRAAAQGRIVWLEWDEKNLPCGSGVRFMNAAEAGAVGVLLTGQSDRFETGIAGYGSIPGAQLNGAATAAMRPALEAGTLAVRLADALKQSQESQDDSVVDTLAGFSSRGVHGTVDDVVKPDVAAPGVNVVSADIGTGTGSNQLSGTSMAAPHTAGIAALVSQAHPGWSAMRVKTALMNTATHTVTGPQGQSLSPLRQGTGRVDARQAVATQVTMASVADPDLVTASFGVVEVARDGYTEKRTVEVTNSGSDPVVFDASLDPRISTPGATLRLSTQQVSVPAGGTARFDVVLSVPDREALRHTLDPEQSAERAATHVTEVSGTVRLTPRVAGVAPLALTAYAAPKPVSSLGLTAATIAKGAASAPLPVTGTGLGQGTGTQRYAARITPMMLAATSKRLPANPRAPWSLAGMDLLQVGVTSTAPASRTLASGKVAFGMRTAGPIIGLGTTSFPAVWIDVDGDAREDFLTTVSFDTTRRLPDVVTYDLGTQRAVDSQPLNGLTSGGIGQWDNDTLVLPVSLGKLGYTDRTQLTTMNWRVTTMSTYAPAGADGSNTVDAVKGGSIDVRRPAVWFGGLGTGTSVEASQAAKVTVNRGSGTSGRLLLIADDDATGQRTSVAAWSAR